MTQYIQYTFRCFHQGNVCLQHLVALIAMKSKLREKEKTEAVQSLYVPTSPYKVKWDHFRGLCNLFDQLDKQMQAIFWNEDIFTQNLGEPFGCLTDNTGDLTFNFRRNKQHSCVS